MIKNIEIAPDKPYYLSHYFCDYIELIALINNGIVSISDIYERFKINESLGGNNEASEIDDEWNGRIQEWFDILAVRESIFNDFYPFEIAGERSNHIQLKNNLSNHHKLYLFLLLSSSLKYIKRDTSTLTSDFEKMSLKVLKNYLPNNAHSRIFGTTATKDDGYIGTLKDKIDALATDLKYTTKYEENSINHQNTGDGGVDLVAWIAFTEDSNQDNIQVFLAQCTTGKNWLQKQHEPDKITNLINFKTFVRVMFVPYDARKNNRGFSEQNDILNILLFDRIRVVYLLASNIKEIMSLSSFEIVQYFIEHKEPIA